MAVIFPIVAVLPSGISGNAVVGVPVYGELYVSEVDYYLRALTSGPYTVTIRDPITNTEIDTNTFNSAGVVKHTGLDIFVPMGNGVVVDVPALGTGAGICTVTIWCNMP